MLTDLAHSNFWWTSIRQLWAFFDKMVYGLMYWLYQVFLAVANQNILGGAVVKALIGRMQLIVGVIFLFIFAIHIVQGIIDPNLFTDKDRGTSKIIIRVIIALMLLSAMIPLNIGGASSNDNGVVASRQEYTWENALSEQGLLFGTMTLFQSKVLETNVLGRLILGSNLGSYEELAGSDDNSSDEESNSLSNAGNYMASSILKMFITPNQQSDDFIKQIREEEDPNYDLDPEGGTQGYICSDTEEFNGDSGRLQYYNDEYEVGFLFGYIDNTCTLDATHAGNNIGDEGQEGDFYQFAYLGGYSTAVGLFVDFILISFTIEIAVRVFKLVILRILGPIAAVSYVMPNSSQSGGMFSSWVKQLVSTYLDVFVRLAIIYFSILVVSGLLSDSGLLFEGASGGVKFTATIFLIIGLFLFAKQAPAFIRQMLGMPESSGKGMFSGIGALVGAGLGLAGIAGGMASKSLGNIAASKARAEAKGEDPNKLGNRMKQFGAGALGLLTGGVGAGLGAATAENNKDRLKNAMDRVNQRNALNMQRARTNSTMTGRVQDRIATFLGGGETPLERDERQIENLKMASDSASSLSDYVRNKGIAKLGQKKLHFAFEDSNGKKTALFNVSYNDLLNKRNAAVNRGEENFTITDGSGKSYTFATSGQESDEMFKQLSGQLGSEYGKAQLKQYQQDMQHLGEAGYTPQADPGFVNSYESAVDNGVYKLGGSSGKGIIRDGEEFNSYRLDKVAGATKGDATRIERSLAHQRNKANNTKKS